MLRINKTEFTTYDVQKALDIPRERFRDWMNRGFVVPSTPAEGSGTKAIFTVFDVYGVALFRNLIDNGFSREVAGEYVKKFVERGKDEPDHQKTARILFKVVGKGDVEVFTFARGFFMFNLETGEIKYDPMGSQLPSIVLPIPLIIKQVYKEWKAIYVVNFEILCKEVDAALAGL